MNKSFVFIITLAQRFCIWGHASNIEIELITAKENKCKTFQKYSCNDRTFFVFKVRY